MAYLTSKQRRAFRVFVRAGVEAGRALEVAQQPDAAVMEFGAAVDRGQRS